MPSWNQLYNEFSALTDNSAKLGWFRTGLVKALIDVSAIRGNRNVVFYASGFLQRPTFPIYTQLDLEDINGLMAVLNGCDWTKHLTLILHTPGGVTAAAQTVVAYLHSKFTDIEVIVPTYAMSAGTMICLGSNRLIMGRQSQLGPIDAQLQGGRVSAGAVVDLFQQAETDILGDVKKAHIWHPILATMGPALLQEARNALNYSEDMVRTWLETRMFAGSSDAASKAKNVAKHFNATQHHKNHSRRIDREEAKTLGIAVEDLEPDQTLQDAVLTGYHIVSLYFQTCMMGKIMLSNHDRVWERPLA